MKKNLLHIAKLFIALFALMIASINELFAQNTEQVSFMNSNGKVFVVVAVVVIIVAGLFIYVFSLDRKISKLEKKEKK